MSTQLDKLNIRAILLAPLVGKSLESIYYCEWFPLTKKGNLDLERYCPQKKWKPIPLGTKRSLWMLWWIVFDPSNDSCAKHYCWIASTYRKAKKLWKVHKCNSDQMSLLDRPQCIHLAMPDGINKYVALFL